MDDFVTTGGTKAKVELNELSHWFKCNCHAHGMTFSYWMDQADECYMSMWYPGHGKDAGFLWNLRAAWNALRGNYYNDQIILDRHDAEILHKLLERFLRDNESSTSGGFS